MSSRCCSPRSMPACRRSTRAARGSPASTAGRTSSSFSAATTTTPGIARPNVLMIEAYVDFLRLIRPDVVHFHHFLTLGIDLITITRRTLPEARIVFTFHEFLAICAADGQMVRRTDKSLCSKASAVRCHQCMPELSPDHFFLREMWMKKHFEAVDVFTTPTRFMVEHYANWGIARERIAVVSNGQADYSGGVRFRDERRSAQPLRLLRPARRQQGRARHPRGGRTAAKQRLHRLRGRDQRRQSALCQRGAGGRRSRPSSSGRRRGRRATATSS